MTDVIIVSEFNFVTNKSFASDNHPITIPARFHQHLKEQGLVDSVRAKINFRKEPPIAGSIRVGWRAGGRYFQITMSKSQETKAIVTESGVTLAVRIMKTPEDWLIQIT